MIQFLGVPLVVAAKTPEAESAVPQAEAVLQSFTDRHEDELMAAVGQIIEAWALYGYGSQQHVSAWESAEAALHAALEADQGGGP